MLDATRQVQLLVSGHGGAALAADRVRRDALLWNDTVLGEAAAQLPAELKAEHRDVDWARPTRLRNRIVHGYWSADLDILVTTAIDDFPSYAADLTGVMNRLEDEPQ